MMEDRHYDKATRAARRVRDQKIRQALRTDGKRPNHKDRRLSINAEFISEQKVG